MKTHTTVMSSGSDFRNYVVRCKCGWAYSNTYLAVKDKADQHVRDGGMKWTDMRRATQPDRNWAWTAPR